MPWMQTFVRDQMRRAQSGEPASIARTFTLFFQPIPEDKQSVAWPRRTECGEPTVNTFAFSIYQLSFEVIYIS